MKYFYSIIISLVISVVAYSQSFELYDEDGNVVTNDTLVVSGASTATTISYAITVKNIGSNSLSVKAKRNEIELVSGTVNYFCWVVCYSPNIDVSTQALTMASGFSTQGAQNLSCDLMPNGTVGTNKILYTIFDSNNMNDSASVLIEYNVTLNVHSFDFQNVVSSPNPNPANEFSTISFSVKQNSKVSLAIYNMLGTKEKEYNFNQMEGEIKILTSDLKNGIYFCKTSINGKEVKTSKLNVNH